MNIRFSIIIMTILLKQSLYQQSNSKILLGFLKEFVKINEKKYNQDNCKRTRWMDELYQLTDYIMQSHQIRQNIKI